jgi:hypothetical protein
MNSNAMKLQHAMLIIYQHPISTDSYFSSTANGNSFGLPNTVQGENLHAPLCLLENQYWLR